MSPAVSSWSGIVSATSGASLAAATVTVNDCVAESPPGSVAVTVTAAVPAARAMIVTTEPSTVTAAAAVSPLSAA